MIALKTWDKPKPPQDCQMCKWKKLTFRIHSVIVVEVEAPIFKLHIVLDAGPEEDAWSDVGVDATLLNIDNPVVGNGGGATAHRLT